MHGWFERARALGVLAHFCQQASVGLPQRRDIPLGCVVQQVCCLMQPAEGGADHRPLVGGTRATVSDQVADAPEVTREPPFSATRSREA